MSKKGHLASEPQQKRLQERDELERRNYERDMRVVMSKPEGRRFVWRILSGYCCTFEKSFNGNADTTIYREGRRAVGVELMQEVQRLEPHAYIEMVQERLRAATDDKTHQDDAETVGRAETGDDG